MAVCLGCIRLLRQGTVGIGGFEVPRHWESVGPIAYLGLFGIFLGAGIITTMPSATMTALILWVWMAHKISVCLLVLMVFAVGRFGSSAAAGVVRLRLLTSGSVAADRVEAGVGQLAWVDGIVCAMLGMSMLLHVLAVY